MPKMTPSASSFPEGHRGLNIDRMHPFLLPRKGRLGLPDTKKMFCPDLKSGDDIFDAERLRGAGQAVPRALR